MLKHRLCYKGVFLEWDCTFEGTKIEDGDIIRNVSPLTREELAVNKKLELESQKRKLVLNKKF